MSISSDADAYVDAISQDETIFKEGWLIKLGANVKSWKKRYFVLRGNEMKYYKKKEDVEGGKVQGEIPLEGCTVSMVPESKHGRKFCFELVPSKDTRVFAFAAELGSDVTDWLSQIKNAMLRIRKIKSRENQKERVSILLRLEEQNAARRVTNEEPNTASTKSERQWSDSAASSVASDSHLSSTSPRHPKPENEDDKYQMYHTWLQETQDRKRRGTLAAARSDTDSNYAPLLDEEEDRRRDPDKPANKCCVIL